MKRISKKGSTLIVDDLHVNKVAVAIDRAVNENHIRFISKNETKFEVNNALQWKRHKYEETFKTKEWGVFEYL